MKLGVIGGTALESVALGGRQARNINTLWGEPSGPVHTGNLGDAQICFINRHGDDHSIPPHRVNYRANIAALRELGVDGILAFSAVGGISSRMITGALVVPDQIVDYTWGRHHSFSEGAGTLLRHVDFTEPYCPEMRQKLLRAAKAEELALVDGGIHGVTQGPRLETAAEIRRMERDGCDLVGMTGMPEASLARELEIPYACLALVVNPAAGKAEGEITMDDISQVMQSAVPSLLALLTRLARLL